MPILLCVLASLALAWARGAAPTRLATLPIRWLGVPFVALLVQIAALALAGPRIAPYALWVQGLTGAAVIAFLLVNLRYRALSLVITGMALNLLVIGLNGGNMPVRTAALAAVGFPEIAARLERDGRYEKSAPLTEHSRLPWLADTIPVPMPLGPGRLVSVGDLFVAAGTFLFFQEALLPRRRRGRVAEPAILGGAGL